MKEIDASKYYFHLRFSIKGKMMIDEQYEDIDQAVRRMNNLGSGEKIVKEAGEPRWGAHDEKGNPIC